MCAAASVLSIASVNCSSVMAAEVMAAGCRYLDDDLVPLREQGICLGRPIGARHAVTAETDDRHCEISVGEPAPFHETMPVMRYARRLVDQPLKAVMRLWAPRSAVGPGRHRVGKKASDAQTHRRDAVDARQSAREIHRRDKILPP
jgi:hypothetical protein